MSKNDQIKNYQISNYINKPYEAVIDYIMKNRIYNFQKTEKAIDLIKSLYWNLTRKEKYQDNEVPTLNHIFKAVEFLIEGFIKTGDFENVKEEYEEYKNLTEDELISAMLLHDIIEDFTDINYEVIKQNFNEQIAKLVLNLTNKKDEYDASIKDKNYKKRLWQVKHYVKADKLIKAMKLCDCLSNASDFINYDVKIKNEDNIAIDFYRRKEKFDNLLMVADICQDASENLSKLLKTISNIFYETIKIQEKGKRKKTGVAIATLLPIAQIASNILQINKKDNSLAA